MSSSLSFSSCLKSAEAICWKTIAAAPRDFMSSDVSSVTCAVAIAKSRSASAVFSFLRPPRIESRKPTLGRDRRLQLRLQALKGLDPLLHRRGGDGKRGGGRLSTPRPAGERGYTLWGARGAGGGA